MLASTYHAQSKCRKAVSAGIRENEETDAPMAGSIGCYRKPGRTVSVYNNAQAITLQLRREAPSEVDVSATSFKASVVLTPADAIAVACELLTAAAAQLRQKT